MISSLDEASAHLEAIKRQTGVSNRRSLDPIRIMFSIVVGERSKTIVVV